MTCLTLHTCHARPELVPSRPACAGRAAPAADSSLVGSRTAGAGLVHRIGAERTSRCTSEHAPARPRARAYRCRASDPFNEQPERAAEIKSTSGGRHEHGFPNRDGALAEDRDDHAGRCRRGHGRFSGDREAVSVQTGEPRAPPSSTEVGPGSREAGAAASNRAGGIRHGDGEARFPSRFLSKGPYRLLGMEAFSQAEDLAGASIQRSRKR